MAEVLAARRLVESRLAQGLETYDAGMGESPLKPPKKLRELLGSCIQSETRYGKFTGSQTFQKHFRPNLTLTGNGLKPLICILQRAIHLLGGKIVLAVPYWPGYASFAHDSRIPFSKLVPTSGCKLTPNDIQKYFGVRAFYPKEPTVLMFSNPCNPTGEIYTQPELDALTDVCARAGIILFEDRIYENLVPHKLSGVHTSLDTGKEHFTFDTKIGSARAACQCPVITGHSLSKVVGAGGWRFGWMLFDPVLSKLHMQCVCLAGNTFSAPSPAFERVAFEIPKYQFQFSEQSKEFIRGYDILRRALISTGIDSTPTQGGWYTLLNFDNVPNIHETISSSAELVSKLADDIGLVALPGTAFGLDEKELSLRISLIVGDFSAWNDICMQNEDAVPKSELKLTDWSRLGQLGVSLKKWVNEIGE